MSETNKADTHCLRPGPIRGSMVLCEPPPWKRDRDFVAELSAAGLRKVSCRDCLFIMEELRKLL